MAFENKCKNLYGDKTFGDLNVVLIKIQDTAIVASESSPDTTVTAAGSGVYNLTFPKGVVGWFVSAQIIALGSAVQAEVVSFSASAGTASIDTGNDLSGGDQCHVMLLVGAP